ncbi:MAG: chloride channel protein [Clostridia bacterium]|nr:chloride channel protein [Clostridia bacterium]
MEKLTLALQSSATYVKILVKWIVIAVLVGIVGGVLGSLFHESIDIVTDIRFEHRWVMYLLPVGGLLIAGMYHFFHKKGHIDTNRVLESVRTEEKVPLVMAPMIFISTVITHFLGGSAGREGAALQLGGSIGYNLGRLFRLNKQDMHVVVMSGMSAVFAALFGTPLTAAFFALEVTCVGVFHYVGLVPCILSAAVASRISLLFGLSPVHFSGIVFPAFSAKLLLQVVILAVLCALVSILFCWTIEKCEGLMEEFLPNRYVRVLAGSAVIILLTVLLGSSDYNGAGMEVITRALQGEARPEAFLLKIIFTAITISAGFKGGEIVPAFFIGSTFGCVCGTILGLDSGFSAALGFVALFCGVVNCPVASVLLALEVFGAEEILVFAIVCGVSYMMSGYFGLYKSQTILYSKLNEDLIDVHTK